MKKSITFIFNNGIMNATSLIEKVIFLIITLLISRYLPRDIYGEYATALGYATFFSIFSTIGISNSLIRIVSLDPDNEKEHLGNVLLLKTLLSVIMYAIMIFSVSMLKLYSSQTILLISILGFVRIGNEYMTTFYSFYNAKERFGIICLYTLFFDIAVLMVTIYAIQTGGDSTYIAITRAAVVLGIIIILALHTLSVYKIRLNFSLLPAFIRSTIPFGIRTVLENVMQRINIVILSFLHGETAGGIFNNGYILVSSLYFISYNFDKIIIPHLYKKFRKNGSFSLQYIFDVSSKILIFLSLGIIMGAFLYGDELITLFFGEKYIQSAEIFKIATISLYFYFSTTGALITSIDRQDIRMYITGFSAAVNIIFCILLGKFYGARGIAWAMVITIGIESILKLLFLMRNNGLKIGTFMFYSVKQLIICAVLGLADSYLPGSSFFVHASVTASLYCIMTYVLLSRKDRKVMISIISGLKKG